MDYKPFGKPKKFFLLTVFIISMSAFPYLSVLGGYSKFHGIIFWVLFCLTAAIGYWIRDRGYRREMAAFKRGEPVKRRVFASRCWKFEKFGVGSSDIKKRLEKLFEKHKMRWSEFNETYLCFTNIFSFWPIALKVDLQSTSKNKVLINLQFHDRFLSPFMIHYIGKNFEKEMDRMGRVIEGEVA